MIAEYFKAVTKGSTARSVGMEFVISDAWLALKRWSQNLVAEEAFKAMRDAQLSNLRFLSGLLDRA